MAIVIDSDHYDNESIYTVDLDGTEITATVTAVSSVVKKWLNDTLYLRRDYINQLVVGLGVQWTPGGYDPPADTMQLCVGRRCLIFQLAHAEYILQRLRTFLQNPNHTFVGFWNHSDRRKLESSEHELEMFDDPIDLRYYTEDLCDEDLAGASVDEIVEKCVGYEVEQKREISMSDWCDEYLSDEQVSYACVDAYCAFLMGKNISAWEL
jgi:hypothetical protein